MSTLDTPTRDTPTRPLLLLDGPSLWFRAYYALPQSLVDAHGNPVNAVRGFLDIMTSLIQRTKPQRLSVALDLDWRPAFRVAAIPSYKTHRVADVTTNNEEVPDTLTPQVTMITDVLTAIGIATAGAPGLEADDVLGTLACQEKNHPVIVVSGDRDLLQLVTDQPPTVRVLYVGRGMAKAELCGPSEVAQRYNIPVERAGAAYAEFALLRGDPSDGLPGVPGIGEKTAATLLCEYGSLEALRHAAKNPQSFLPKRIRTKLLDAENYLDLALPVVKVKIDASVEFSDSDELPTTAIDPPRLSMLASQLNIESSIARMENALTHLHDTTADGSN